MANRTNKYLDGAGLTYLIQKIKTVLNSKQDALTFDSTPTANSTNPVTSQGIKTELDKKASKVVELLSVPTIMKLAEGEYTEENPATLTADEVTELNNLATDYLNGQQYTILGFPCATDVLKWDAHWNEDDGMLMWDARQGENLNHLHLHKSSNGYWATSHTTELQTKLTFDETPTSGSSNPVESGGIHTAIQNATEFYKIPSADVTAILAAGYYHVVQDQTILNTACEAILTALKNNKRITWDYIDGYDVTNFVIVRSEYVEPSDDDKTVQLLCVYGSSSFAEVILTKSYSTSNWSASMGGQSLVPSVQGDGNAITDVNTTDGQFILNKDKTFLESESDPVFTASVAHGITSSDIANWNSKTSNVGTITGITMNGASKGTSGVVDLGTVITEHQDISGKVDKETGKGLSSNDYTDAEKTKLSGIATGAEVNVQSDWNQTTTTADDYIKNKPSLATVATSGSYSDLSNKPTIPTVNNATLTIQKNGTNVATFTANASSNATANITVPTATSDLTNDSGFVTGSKMYIGTCTTAAATNPKDCTVETFPLNNGEPLDGTTICVRFTATDTSTSTSPTLNVNDTGAKRIWYNNALLATAKSSLQHGYANRYIYYVYDSSLDSGNGAWVWLGCGVDNNTTYSNASLGQGYAEDTRSSAVAAVTATISSYSLTVGGVVSIHFKYDVPANATLNIRTRGAKAIYYKNAPITAGVIKAGDTATFIYTTYYHLISIDRSDGTDLTNYYTKSEVNTALSGKQATLVSGTNLKTINNESLLGSGNISIQGGGGSANIEYNSSKTALVIGGGSTKYTISLSDTELLYPSVKINDFTYSSSRFPLEVNSGDILNVVVSAGAGNTCTTTMGGTTISTSTSFNIQSVSGNIEITVSSPSSGGGDGPIIVRP